MIQDASITQPAVFVSHGSPMLALENGPWRAALNSWAASLVGVRAVVVASAHWESRGGFRVSASARPGVLHDFSGFPDALYQLDYGAPGDAKLAARIVEMLKGAGLPVVADADRPLDHGVWVPLRAMFPEASLPVIQVSLPRPRETATLVKAGQVLAPLRSEGVLLMGSGGLVHNLWKLSWDGHPNPEAWATDFEDWIMSGVQDKDVNRLLGAAQHAPGFADAAPTSEHLDPIYFALGAADGGTPSTVFKGWQHGNLSLRAISWMGTQMQAEGAA
jgi:4,5-DOPA dioxygenase extradiol